jgi:hypothetical protein
MDRRRVGRAVRKLRRLAGAFHYSGPSARERVTVTKDGVMLDMSWGPMNRVVSGTRDGEKFIWGVL